MRQGSQLYAASPSSSCVLRLLTKPGPTINALESALVEVVNDLDPDFLLSQAKLSTYGVVRVVCVCVGLLVCWLCVFWRPSFLL